MIDKEIENYVSEKILPQYAAFDLGHNRDHAESVIAESLKLALEHQADEAMAFVVAAYHDLGLKYDRKFHHIFSAKMLLNDKKMKKWFTEEQLHTMAEAIEDHRASSKNPPRTIYGAIVSEADRDIAAAVRRAVQYRLYDAVDGKISVDNLIENTSKHLKEKYCEEGYTTLALHSIRNEENLAKLRELLKDDELLKTEIRKIYEDESRKLRERRASKTDYQTIVSKVNVWLERLFDIDV